MMYMVSLFMAVGEVGKSYQFTTYHLPYLLANFPATCLM